MSFKLYEKLIYTTKNEKLIIKIYKYFVSLLIMIRNKMKKVSHFI